LFSILRDDDQRELDLCDYTYKDLVESRTKFLQEMHRTKETQIKGRLHCTLSFLCDYADQSDQHMSFIAKKLEIIKGEIAVYHEKNQQVPEHSKGEKLAGLVSCSVPLKKGRTWARGNTHKHG
jgi:hypothetical protein